MDEAYNDIQPWHFKELVKDFGAKEGEYRTYQIKTKEQAHKLFEDKEFNAAGVLQFVELYVPKKDAPRALKLTAEASAANNAKLQ
jgi:pyruvate decarboxylase